MFVVEERGIKRVARLVPIGELVDALMDQHAGLIACDEHGTQILDGRQISTTYYAQSFDPCTGRTGLYRIQAFTRHMAPAAMYRVQTTCGRAATLTGDHNLWVLRDGRLRLIKTTEAQLTDYVPVPETLLQEGNLKTLDMLAELSDQRLFVDASPALVEYVDEYGSADFADVIQAHGLSGYSKVSAARYQRHGRGIPVAIFQDVLAHTQNLGGYYDPQAARVGGKRSANSMPAQLELNAGIAPPNWLLSGRRDRTARIHHRSQSGCDRAARY